MNRPNLLNTHKKAPDFSGAFQCRRWELNPHDREGHCALNAARLPIPPLRHVRATLCIVMARTPVILPQPIFLSRNRQRRIIPQRTPKPFPFLSPRRCVSAREKPGLTRTPTSENMPQTILDQLNLTLDDVIMLPGRERSRLLNFLLRWEYFDATHTCLDALIPQNPTLVSLLDLRARAFLAQARYTDALTVMQQRLQMRTSMTARALEARIHLAQGDHYTARSIAQKLVDENPEGSTAWATLADIQLAMSDVDAAFATYRHLNEIAPRSRAYLLGMMAIYQARADWVTASGYATRLLRIAEEEGASTALHPPPPA